ncbi:hypothetical protein [Glaciecola sp. 1036]|uniref:hypothetical protein n=1 Tax=Alteromonadaceae TaxID=72275 RepID=UPI003CFE22B2
MATKKQKTSIVLLVLVFALPVVLAKFALELDWFNKGATNKGTLLSPTLEAESLLLDAQRKWHLMYVLPENCELSCQNAIYAISQVKTAVGRESDRVNVLVITTEQSDDQAVASLATENTIEVLRKDAENVNNVFKDVGVDAIFISDTLHNVVLSYPVTQDKDQAIMDSRDILADLRKLLKLSRIG